jgi:hypothetical protein
VNGDPTSLDDIRLSELDQIATPSPLALKVGQAFYGEEPRGQAFIYPIAGSFVEFLIETRGMEAFHMLYMSTPFVPLERMPDSPDRWIDAYGLSLADLELQWKTLMVGVSPGQAGDAEQASPTDLGHGRTES